jgi:hypothetical protein
MPTIVPISWFSRLIFITLLDDGQFFLIPDMVGNNTRHFEVAFAEPPPPGRYTTVVNGVCVELRDGHRVAAESCGDGNLHQIMNQLRALGQLYQFYEGGQ